MTEAARKVAEKIADEYKERGWLGPIMSSYVLVQIAEKHLDAFAAEAVQSVQHVCTNCGYIALTQSVTTEQIVAKAVRETWGTAADKVEYMGNQLVLLAEFRASAALREGAK